jgi:multimeric flavodoxin WrbA
MKMKILGVSGSPRSKGNTVILLEEALKGAESEGAETDLVSVSGKDLRGCDGCNVCFTKGECHIKDEMHMIHDAMAAADGIIFGTPIYVYGMTAQMKAIIDRTYGLHKPEKRLTNKVGSVVVVAGSLGIIDSLKDFYFFFAVQRMLAANFVGAYATEKGTVTALVNGMKASFNLGREMVQLVNKRFEYSSEFNVNFFGYGTHTH